jgi:antitoxin HicB
MELKDYIKLPYSRVLIPEDSGGYSCLVLELPGCFSQGETLKEAIENIDEAIELWIETSLDLGYNIPVPFATSNQVQVYLSLEKEKYKQLFKTAFREKVTIQEFICSLI